MVLSEQVGRTFSDTIAILSCCVANLNRGFV